MKRNAKIKTLLCMAALSFSLVTPAQINLVWKGKPASRIVVTTTEKTDSIAASMLQDFVQRISSAKLPIIPSDQLKKGVAKGDVLIGNGLTNEALKTPELKEDGYLLTTEDGHLRVVSGVIKVPYMESSLCLNATLECSIGVKTNIR